MSLSERERDIYTRLGSKLRGVGLPQLLRGFFPDSASGRINGKRWVSARERSGLLETFTVLCRPVVDVELYFRGEPGLPPPDFAELSRESCRRWDIPSQPTTIVRGTTKLRNIVGGPSQMRFRAIGQIGHDLGTAAVYLKLLRDAPELTDGWLCEDEIEDPAYKEAKSDAVILNQAGEVIHVVEFASGYQSEKFAKIDRTFRPDGIPYEIWMRRDK